MKNTYNPPINTVNDFNNHPLFDTYHAEFDYYIPAKTTRWNNGRQRLELKEEYDGFTTTRYYTDGDEEWTDCGDYDEIKIVGATVKIPEDEIEYTPVKKFIFPSNAWSDNNPMIVLLDLSEVEA